MVRTWPCAGERASCRVADSRPSRIPSGQTKLRKIMDPTKIAPFDNVGLFILRNFLTFPSFNSKRGCIARWDRRGWKVVGPLRRGTLAEVVSLSIPIPP
jgi:hypothetical protein